jgi:hypothetical protein
MDAYFEHRPELRSTATQRKALMPVFRDCLDKSALDLTPPLAQLAIDKWGAGAVGDIGQPRCDLLQADGKMGVASRFDERRFRRVRAAGAAAKKQLVLS